MLGRGVAVALALACARAQVMVLERAPAHDDAIPLLALAASPYVPMGPVLMVTAAGDDAAAGAPPCEHMMMDAVDDDALDDDDVDGLLPALFARVLARRRGVAVSHRARLPERRSKGVGVDGDRPESRRPTLPSCFIVYRIVARARRPLRSR